MHPVVSIVLQRLGLGLLTLFFVSVIIFMAIEMLPGDFTQAVLGQAATEETVAAFRRELGLDQPSYIRYFDWIVGVLQGDFGTSFSGRAASGVDRSREVVDLIGPRLANTLFLAGMTAVIELAHLPRPRSRPPSRVPAATDGRWHAPANGALRISVG